MKAPHTKERRTITIDGRDTSIELEIGYWNVIETWADVGKTDWRDIVVQLASNQPPDCASRAAWVRLKMFAKVMGDFKKASAELKRA